MLEALQSHAYIRGYQLAVVACLGVHLGALRVERLSTYCVAISTEVS